MEQQYAEKTSRVLSEMIEEHSNDAILVSDFVTMYKKEPNKYDTEATKITKSKNNKILEGFCNDVLDKTKKSYPCGIIETKWRLYIEGVESTSLRDNNDILSEAFNEEIAERMYNCVCSKSTDELVDMGSFVLTSVYQYLGCYHTLVNLRERQKVFKSQDPKDWMEMAKYHSQRARNYPFDLERLSEVVDKMHNILYCAGV